MPFACQVCVTSGMLADYMFFCMAFCLCAEHATDCAPNCLIMPKRCHGEHLTFSREEGRDCSPNPSEKIQMEGRAKACSVRLGAEGHCHHNGRGGAEACFTEVVHIWAHVQGGGAQIVQIQHEFLKCAEGCCSLLAVFSVTLSAGARGVTPQQY